MWRRWKIMLERVFVVFNFPKALSSFLSLSRETFRCFENKVYWGAIKENHILFLHIPCVKQGKKNLPLNVRWYLCSIILNVNAFSSFSLIRTHFLWLESFIKIEEFYSMRWCSGDEECAVKWDSLNLYMVLMTK